MTIYLIRHGKTEANEKHLYCGSTDLPLSERGREELGQLHYEIKNVRFLTSGMRRTDETLRILFGEIPFDTDPRFREVDFGVFEMYSYEELKDNPAYQIWCTGDNEEYTSQRRKRLTDEAASPGSLLGDQRRYCSRLPRWCHCSNHGTSVPGGEQDPL